MRVVYAPEPFPSEFSRAVFLVGPTPRAAHVPSWRPAALAELERQGFDGVVFVPEPRDGAWLQSYDDQLAWETEGLALADAILCWVPRSLPDMPALTTNVEFGMWVHSGKLAFGAPDDAASVRYLTATAQRLGVPNATTLPDTVAAALQLVGPGAARRDAERYVPAEVFTSDTFRAWYVAQRGAGNELRRARVEWTLRVGPRRRIFLWVVHAEVHIGAENRVKSNEVVMGRPDISVVAALAPADRVEDTRVVLVREFRTPARTHDAFIRELPGGSSLRELDPRAVAVAELAEETGLTVAPDRLVALGARQLVGTLSAHCAHLFAVALDAAELAALEARAGQPFGVAGDTERTFVEVWTVADVLSGAAGTDWSTTAMVVAAAARFAGR